jgi:hypothetical protein
LKCGKQGYLLVLYAIESLINLMKMVKVFPHFLPHTKLYTIYYEFINIFTAFFMFLRCIP